ncbi:hypothetical protein DFH09DRAFT_1076504 [Mycena vulgaris]|nr:hypothetical protein DFH09DRAFT_1076504 [Mycena vulgaris]
MDGPLTKMKVVVQESREGRMTNIDRITHSGWIGSWARVPGHVHHANNTAITALLAPSLHPSVATDVSALGGPPIDSSYLWLRMHMERWSRRMTGGLIQQCHAPISGGAIFSGSQNFTMAGGTFNSVTKNYNIAPTAHLDLRIIPQGDINLDREIRFNTKVGVLKRKSGRNSMCRVYSATIQGRKATVAIYQADGAEENGGQRSRPTPQLGEFHP